MLPIDLQSYSAFVLASTILMLIPGPNVAFIVANSVAYGIRYGFLTVAGTSFAMLIQLSLTIFGLSAAVGALWFQWVRWIGVIYLVSLGLRLWFSAPADLTKTPIPSGSGRSVFLRGFLVSLTNPKTLLFYGAFFPQFMVEDKGSHAHAVLLGLTFLFLAVLIDGTWALLAGRARLFLTTHGLLRNRLSGSALIIAGVFLALVRK